MTTTTGLLTKGQYVKTWFDTGAFGATILYGYVVSAGPRTARIMWESGLRNRVYRDWPGIDVLDGDEAAHASEIMRGRGLVGEVTK